MEANVPKRPLHTVKGGVQNCIQKLIRESAVLIKNTDFHRIDINIQLSCYRHHLILIISQAMTWHTEKPRCAIFAKAYVENGN